MPPPLPLTPVAVFFSMVTLVNSGKFAPASALLMAAPSVAELKAKVLRLNLSLRKLNIAPPTAALFTVKLQRSISAVPVMSLNNPPPLPLAGSSAQAGEGRVRCRGVADVGHHRRLQLHCADIGHETGDVSHMREAALITGQRGIAIATRTHNEDAVVAHVHRGRIRKRRLRERCTAVVAAWSHACDQRVQPSCG